MAIPMGRRSHGGQSSVKNSEISRPERHGYQHRNERCYQSAIDRRQGTEFLGDGIPSFLEQKVEPKGLERRHGAFDQRQNDAAEQHEDQNGRGARQEMKRQVAYSQPAQSPGAGGGGDVAR